MQWKLQNASHRRYFMRKCHKDHRELPAWARKALHLEQEEGDKISGAALLAAVTVNQAAPGRQCCLVKDADDLSWGKIVDTWMSCDWMERWMKEKVLEVGFAVLLAAIGRGRRQDREPVKPHVIDSVPGERPAVFCHQCHWVGVPESETIQHCGSERTHFNAISLYRDWDWQAQWNAVGRPRSWLPQWETDPTPGPWELRTQPDDPLPPWHLGKADMPPPRPPTPPDFEWPDLDEFRIVKGR